MTDEAEDPRKQLHAAARRLHRHHVERNKLVALRDEEIDRANRWFDDMAAGENAEILRLSNEIEAWAREHRDEHTKSWKTPWGTVSTVATKGKTIVDDEAALRAWAKAHGFVEVQPDKIQVGEIRKVATLDEDTGRLFLNIDKTGRGEFGPLPVPGVHVEATDAFNVHITIKGD